MVHGVTDYRTLNAIIIKGTFPIPILDDLIDELHGVSFFFKIGFTIWISLDFIKT